VDPNFVRGLLAAVPKLLFCHSIAHKSVRNLFVLKFKLERKSPNRLYQESHSSGLVKYLYSQTQTWHITHPDSREVLQFSNGQEEVSPSISRTPPPPFCLYISYIFTLFSLFSVFLPYFLYFGTSLIRTPERCYSSAMDRRRLVCLSFIPPSLALSSLLPFSVFLPYFLYFGTSPIRTPERCYSSAMEGEEVSPSISHTGTPLKLSLSLSFFCLSPVLPFLWHITHLDSREVLQFSNGQEEFSPSISQSPPPCLFLFFLSCSHIIFFVVPDP
jgi:hypothetical protein